MKRVRDSDEIRDVDFIDRRDYKRSSIIRGFYEYDQELISNLTYTDLLISRDTLINYQFKEYFGKFIKIVEDDKNYKFFLKEYNCFGYLFNINSFLKIEYEGLNYDVYVILKLSEENDFTINLSHRLSYIWQYLEELTTLEEINLMKRQLHSKILSFHEDIKRKLKKFLYDMIRKYALLPREVLRAKTERFLGPAEDLLEKFLGLPNIKGGKIHKSKHKSTKRKSIKPRKSRKSRK